MRLIIIGRLILIIPCFVINDIDRALFVSIGITCIVLLLFGYYKAIITGTRRRRAVYSAFKTLGIRALTVAVSYGIIKGVSKGFSRGIG